MADSNRVATIVLLVEDRNQENLLRRYLKCLDHTERNIRVERLAHGQGSGEQFVRENYAKQVRATRRQSSKTKACLITMVDADMGSLENRMRQFERALKDAQEEPRQADDPIVNLIPRRNVETWILCLNSNSVDEETNYHHDPRVNPESIKNAAERLFEWTRPNAKRPASCVPSLLACLPEFDRIPKN